MNQYKKKIIVALQLCIPIFIGASLSSAAGLSDSTAQLSASIGEQDKSYHAAPRAQGFRMQGANPLLSAEFTPTGVIFHQQEHRWGMALRRYGYGQAMKDAHDAAQPKARLNRVEYRRGDMVEWYVNGPAGIEQGFTLERAPGAANGEPLSLAFALSGGLTPTVDADGRGLTLRKSGIATFRYAGLTAWDARGRKLRSWLEADRNELSLRVDDAAAQYPLTIDPYIQAAALTTAKQCNFGGSCDDGKEFGYFGLSVSISGDGKAAVVGGAGAAYVFVRPPVMQGGWGSPLVLYYAAKLVPSEPSNARARFGQAVAMDGDGSNIVVGSPAGYEESRLYVYTRPVAGWGSANPMTETAILRAGGWEYNGNLGKSVAISADGKTIVGGAPTTSAGWGQGTAYLYRRSNLGFGWLNAGPSATMYLDTQYWVPGNNFGESVSVSADGSIVLVGSPNANYLSWGKAYIFQGSFGYTPTAVFHTSDSNLGQFGAAVSLSADGSTAVVGASGCVGAINCQQNPSGSYANAAYVYLKPGPYWWDGPMHRNENARLKPSTPSTSTDYFASGVTVNGDGGVIAAPMPNATQGGSVYVFNRPNTGWISAAETSKFTPTNGPFTVSISSDGTAILSGSPKAVMANQVYHGVAYVSTGSAQVPQASLSPMYLTFAAQPVGSTSAPKQVTLNNNGNAPLHVTSVAANSAFTSTQNCVTASPLAPGASCSESVTFRPMAAGPYSGTVTFTDDHGGTPGALQAVFLQGDGIKGSTATSITSVAPNPVLAGQPMTIAYSVAAQNGATLTPTGVVTVKASSGETCTGSAPTGSCVLTFATAANRTVTATYGGNANLEGSVSTAASVRVSDFAVAVSPASQTVNGRKATYTVTVSSVNGFTGAVSLGCSGGPANTTCAMSPTSVVVSGASVGAKVTFTIPPNTAVGAYPVSATGQAGGAIRSGSATLVVK